MNIIRAIVLGEYSPIKLVKHWNKQMKASREEAQKSLEGNYKEENIFVLSQALSSYDFHRSQMLECETRIEKVLKQMASISDKTDEQEIKIENEKNKKNTKQEKMNIILMLSRT